MVRSLRSKQQNTEKLWQRESVATVGDKRNVNRYVFLSTCFYRSYFSRYFHRKIGAYVK